MSPISYCVIAIFEKPLSFFFFFVVAQIESQKSHTELCTCSCPHLVVSVTPNCLALIVLCFLKSLWIQPFNSMNFALLSLAGPFPLMSAIGQCDVYFLLLWFLLYRFLIMIFPSNSRILFFKKKPQCGRVPLIGIFRFVMFNAVMFWTSYIAVYCFSACFFIPPNYQMYCILHCFNLLH